MHRTLTYIIWNSIQNVGNIYKGVQYSTCVQCLPEDKRKIALEKIAYGKQMEELHKGLGID